MNDLRLVWTESRSDNDRVTYFAWFEDYYLEVMPDARVYWLFHCGCEVTVGSCCLPRDTFDWAAATYALQYTAECIMQGHWLALQPDRYGEGAYNAATREQWLQR